MDSKQANTTRGSTFPNSESGAPSSAVQRYTHTAHLSLFDSFVRGHIVTGFFKLLGDGSCDLGPQDSRRGEDVLR